MDIACPNCAASYRVPDSLLGHGTALRCAACSQEWVPEAAAAPAEPPATLPAEPDVALPPAAKPAALPEALPTHPPPPRPAPPTTPPPLQRRYEPGQPSASAPGRPSGRLLPLAWVASVTCLLVALLALVLFGEEVAAAWPPFARITALLNG